MGNKFCLPVGTGSGPFGRTSAAYGILAATSHRVRTWGVDIFNFTLEIFLLAFDLTLFLPGRAGMRVESQKPQSLESSVY